MPTLLLKVAPLQNTDRFQSLATALTNLTEKILGKRREVTALVIEDFPATRWYVGGQDIQRPMALLEISITQGTNTQQEKAYFIAAAFAELQRQLGFYGGELGSASYVIVRELPADDWGYGGRTQASRRTPAMA